MNVKVRAFKGVQGFVFLILFFDSTMLWAQTDFYIPKSLIIPVHTQQQQLHISAGLGGGYDVNLSYAFTKHLAIFTAGTLKKGTDKRTSFWGDRFNIEKDDYALKGGLGYFKATNKRVFDLIELYAGAGRYKVDNYRYYRKNSELDNDVTKANFWNIFWQFNAVHKIRKHEITAALRLAYSKYTDLQFWSTHPNSSHIRSRFENLWGITAEPAASYSYIFNKLKFNVQAGLAIPLLSVPVTKIDTHTFPDQTIVLKDERMIKEVLFAALGRLSVGYNFNFKKK